jgi:hypothetical protein
VSATEAYLLDSDVLITAKNRYYAFSICPGFWDSLLHAHRFGRLHSIDRVQQELLNGSDDDDLVQWVGSAVPAEFFHSCGETEVVNAFKEIMLWAQRHRQFTDAAKANFASGADGWLVAFSKVKRTIVVTNEQPAPDAKKEIKLPDVCNAFGVPYCDTFAMLQALRLSYSFTPSA